MDNRQLDSVIAEKVMGWKLENIAISSSGARADVWRKGDSAVEFCRDWKPTEDIAAAWQVVEKINTFPSQDTFRDNMEVDIFSMPANEVATTICLAALKAVGVEIVEDEK